SGIVGFYSNDFFYIVPDKCTECVGFHDEPQCVSVCPVDSVVKRP
ncbi:MAG: ferredoxin, partial [Ignavibacteria bacterium]